MISPPVRAPDSDVTPQPQAERPERSEPVQEDLVPGQDDPASARPSEAANGGGEPGQTTADHDLQEEQTSEERDAGSGRTHASGATEQEPSISEPHAPDPSAIHDAVVEAWRQYRQHGDGHFNVVGFRRQLTASGLRLSVNDGARVQAGETVLLVESPSHPVDRFLVVPNFMKSPQAAPDWFEDVGDGALTRRTKKVHRLGEGEWSEAGFKIIEKGRIE